MVEEPMVVPERPGAAVVEAAAMRALPVRVVAVLAEGEGAAASEVAVQPEEEEAASGAAVLEVPAGFNPNA